MRRSVPSWGLAGLVLAGALLSACSSGGGGSSAPLPQPTPTGGQSSAPQNVTFVITVPPAPPVPASSRISPRYVSPATQSMVLQITAPATQQLVLLQIVNLTKTSPGCAPAAAGLVCTVTARVAPGTYTVTIATYSGAGGFGAELSQGQQQAFGVVPGGANQIRLTLYGIPAQLTVAAISPAIAGSQSAGFTLSGIYAAPRPFVVNALDASGNTIVGSGSPSFGVASSNASFAVTPPSAQSPNAFSLAPGGSSAATTRLTITASAGSSAACRQPGAVCSAQVAVAYQPFASDDWLTFAHDFQRTGRQSQPTQISASTVSQLAKRWSTTLTGGVYASPLVYKGNVIVSTTAGMVYDLSASNGAILWSTTLESTPVNPPTGRSALTLDPDDGLLLTGDKLVDNGHPMPTLLYALRIADGSVAWKETLPGVPRSSAVYANGTFYQAWSGGDPPVCINGGVTAIDANTGARKWTWLTNVMTNPGGGGGVWGAIAYDGSNLYFGTGNTCSPSTAMQGANAINLSGVTQWSFIADQDNHHDDDTGGGVMVQNGQATFINKNGSVYNLVAATGKVNWATPLGASPGYGGFASPASDGSVTVIGAGSFPVASPAAEQRSMDLDRLCRVTAKPDNVVPGYTSKIYGVGPTGNVLWSIPMQSRLVNAAAVNNELAWIGLDTTMYALNVNTGGVQWSFADPSGAIFDAGPVVVPSGVYFADEQGNVFAFSLPAAGSGNAAVRSK